MGSQNTAKAAAIIMAAWAVLSSCFTIATHDAVGIAPGCTMAARFLYPFFHVGFLHAALDAWCLLSIVFIYDISVWRLLLAYAIAVSFPVDTLARLLPPHAPTVGLSGIVYALFASISFEVARKRYYQCWMLFYLLAGFLLPAVNAYLHLYCYLCGLVVALLNKPIYLKR